MGGSSGGGESSGSEYSDQQNAWLEQQAAMARDMQAMSKEQPLLDLSAGKLSPQEERFMNAQMEAIASGQLGATQAVEQRSREQSTARGLFSSAGAIADEAGQVGNLYQQYAGQRAGVYGQMADLSRQGVLQGYGLRQSMLGGAGGLMGSAAAGQGGLAAQQYQRYQGANNMGMQNRQMGMQGAMGAGQLISSFFS